MCKKMRPSIFLVLADEMQRQAGFFGMRVIRRRDSGGMERNWFLKKKVSWRNLYAVSKRRDETELKS